MLHEHQIMDLLKKYETKLDLVSNIIAAYIENNALENGELTRLLCSKTKQEWIPGLLKQGKL